MYTINTEFSFRGARKILGVLPLLFFVFLSCAQTVEVPENIEFAGMKLELTKSARKLIQTDVEAIMRNPKYLQDKVGRANLYFPIIEKIFDEEGFPKDFKFLALQESNLVSDAVSSSNAVGYWQFKKETAQEVGLRVDNEVDERINIVSSTRGAAKYLKRNNGSLNNWVYALLSYNLGLGGVKSQVKEKYRGAGIMEIDSDMHWYVMRFLAHMLAYEKLIGGKHPDLVLIEYTKGNNKSMKEIAAETNTNQDALVMYNKWLLKSNVPGDKTYTVILPVSHDEKHKHVNNELLTKVKEEEDGTKVKVKKKKYNKGTPPAGYDPYNEPAIVTNNELQAVQARKGDNFATLAYGGGISMEEFLKFNDLEKYDNLKVGQYYYLEPKKTSAIELFHTVQPGETLWDISQKYGIRINNIKKKNRLKIDENPQVGLVLWLKNKRPKHTPPEVKPVSKPVEKPIAAMQESVVKPKEAEKENTSVKEKIEQEEDSSSMITQAKPAVKNEETTKAEEPIKPKEEIIAEERPVEEIKPVKVQETVKPKGKVKPEAIVQPEEEKEENTETPNSKEIEHPSAAGNVTYTASSDGYHEVLQGQTLYSLSRLYKVSVEDLKEWNPGIAAKGLTAGERIKVQKEGHSTEEITPQSFAVRDEKNTIYHEVKMGETLYRISKLYGVSVKNLQEWNHKNDYAVNIGEKIVIYK